jgi:hypothetical protein
METNWSGIIVSVIITVLVAAFIFALIRAVILWYFQIDKRTTLLEEQNQLLRDILEKLNV